MVALRRGDIEVDVLSGDGTGLGIIGTVDVVLLQHDFLLVGSQLRHLLGDQGRSTVGQMGSSEDQVDLGQFTTTGLGVEQPDERESDGVLDGKEEKGPSTNRSSCETRTRQSAGIFSRFFSISPPQRLTHSGQDLDNQKVEQPVTHRGYGVGLSPDGLSVQLGGVQPREGQKSGTL